MKTFAVLASVALALTLFGPQHAEAFGSGAGMGVCANGYAGGVTSGSHGTLQSGDGGYSLSFSPALASGNLYTPGQAYTVTVVKTTNTVDGFFVLADRGTTAVADASNTKTGPCGANAGITHNSRLMNAVTVTFTWTAPSAGDASIRTTILTNGYGSNYYIFTTALSSAVGTTCTAAPDCAALNRDACENGVTDNTCGTCNDGYYESSGMAVAKNDDTCLPCNDACETCTDGTAVCDGNCALNYELVDLTCVALQEKNFTLGSVLRDPSCDGTTDDTTCPVVARWGREGDVMNFKIILRDVSDSIQWAGFAFNPTEADMPGSDIMTGYIASDGSVAVVNRYATERDNPPPDADQSGITRVGGSRVGNVFTVEWSRTLAPINSNDASFLPGAESRYVMVAYGVGHADDHGERNGPVVSTARVDLLASTAVQSEYANLASVLIALHALFMMVGWLLLAPSATVIAHMMRFTAPLWFKLHRNMQVVAVLVTIAGIIVVFVEVGEFKSSRHAALGLVVLACSLFQVIIGFARNIISNKDSNATDPHDHGPRRWLFNYMHWLVGLVSLILGLVTIYLGLDFYGAGENRFAPFYFWIAVDVIVAILAFLVTKDNNNSRVVFAIVAFYVAVSAAAVVAITAILFSVA